MEKNGMLTEKSISDFDNTKTAQYVDQDGFMMAHESDKDKLTNPVKIDFTYKGEVINTEK